MSSPATAHIEALKDRADSTRSIELTARKTIDVKSDGQADYTSTLEQYAETAAGLRRCRFMTMNGDKTHGRIDHFSDGERSAAVLFVNKHPEYQELIIYKNHYSNEGQSDRLDRPMPLLTFYVGREPLHVALASAQYLGKGKVLGRNCDEFMFTNVRWSLTMDQVYSLDETTSIPLMIQAYPAGATRELKNLSWDWKAESINRIQGRPLVVKSTMTAYTDGKPFGVWHETLESIAFDKTFDRSEFQPVPEPGVWVYDSVTEERHRTPGESRWVDTTAKSGAGESVQVAVQPTNGDAIWAASSLVLGIAILLAGLLVWWKRR